jgi:hypothetical protein
MLMRLFLRTLILSTVLLWAVAASAADMTKLNIVVKTQGGHPIDRAEVIVRWHADKKHPRAGFGKAVRTTFEVRTNQDGEAKIPTVPQGNILIQVNAKGFQTFGKVYEIDEEEKTVEVTLNPPQQQYSAHD